MSCFRQYEHFNCNACNSIVGIVHHRCRCIYLNYCHRCHVDQSNNDITTPTSDANNIHNIKHKLTGRGLSVGKGVIGEGVSGRVTETVGANVLFVCADTIAMEAELIRMDVIESFIFD